MAAIDTKADIDKIVAERDANGDGQLNADELPKGAFSSMLFEQLLNAQEYRDATPDARKADDDNAIAQLFARADIDGDGVLSQEEWDAERALNMSRFADSGETGDVVFLVRPGRGEAGAEDGDAEAAGLRPEDILVGRRMALTPISADELPDDFKERMDELVRAFAELPEDKKLQQEARDPETVRAELIARIDEIPMSSAFMTG